ncbi:hypothetical protein [Xanthomonas hortorum]|uniref:hypothetical protein n=1 Tax=Xanthomonas hortorum TaxID=56454 RepID=UPI003CCFBF73
MGAVCVAAAVSAVRMWGLRTPAAPHLQTSGAARPALHAGLASARPPARVGQGLFDSAMQQLACREQAEERAAQIAHGSARLPPLDARGCFAGTQLQIEALLRTSAARGDADAQRYLLAQRATEVLQRAVSVAPAGMPAQLSASDEQEVVVIVAELETLALAGHRDAIETLAQVVESPLLHAPDPVYAAAWRLAARQPPGRALDAGAPLQAEDELLESMTQQQQQQARALAVELFGYCCTHAAAAR